MASQINPLNIDGNYPVANQDNNSQGFRDNFTNIRVNFQDAAAEITDLQNKAILKAPLSGESVLNNNMNDALLLAAKIQDFSATRVVVPETSGTVNINYILGHYQSITTSGSITLAFNNFPPVDSYGYIKLQINITNTAHTVTLPDVTLLGTAGIQGFNPATRTITFANTGIFEFAFGTFNSGAAITVFDLNRALVNFVGANVTIGTVTATTANVSGTVNAGNVSTTGVVSAVGNITGATITANSALISVGNVSGANFNTVGAISATGNIAGGNVSGFLRPTTGSASQAPIVLTAGTNISVPVAGAVEYNGTVFFATVGAGARGLMPAEQFVVLNSNYTGNDSSAAQRVFNVPSDGAVSLAANTTYFFEAQYIVAPAITFNAESLRTAFALSGTISSIRYIADASTALSSGTANVRRTQGTAITAQTVTDAAPGGAATNFTVQLRGVIRTNTAGTLTPQFAFTGSPGSAPVVQANSFFRIVPAGSATVTNLGAWT
jgi:hypothetical protein